jgi:hypothetical protein
MQRDDRSGPELAVDVVEDYYTNAVSRAKEELQRVSLLTDEQISEAREKEIADAKAAQVRFSTEKSSLRDAYESMLAKVQSWKPPTSEHDGLRDFMCEQIIQSIRFDCGEISRFHSDRAEFIAKQSPSEWHAEKIEQAARRLADAEKSLREEIERTASRNEWKRQLCESIGRTFGTPASTLADGG